MKRRVERWLYDAFAGHTPGLEGHTPGDWLSIELPHETWEARKVVRTSNDGHDLWIGYPQVWWGSLNPKQARALAWFILWNWWAKATWCGLRQMIYFRLLHRSVERMKRRAALSYTEDA